MTAITASPKDMANAIRALSMDAVQAAKSGHPGMPMGMADVATVLYRDVMKFDAARPDWADRDRFILSAGHGSMLLYSLLYLTGTPDMTIDQIKNFRQLGAMTAGHPEYGHAPGIETTTGPLGQGVATAVGFALAERIMNAKFGDDLVDHHTWVIAGDGCLMEGISQEAISLAGHLKLNKMIVLWDDNNISIDGELSLTTSDDQEARFKASNWNVIKVDGHNQDAVKAAMLEAKTSDKPTLIACKTEIGFGSPNKQGKSAAHGAPLGEDEIVATREALGWPHAAFDVPEDVLNTWRAVGARGADESAAWDARLDASADAAEFKRRMAGELNAAYDEALASIKNSFLADKPKLATRQSSQKVLAALTEALPEMIGGSADLTGSNGTQPGLKPVTPTDYDGRYMHWGIREHGMAAAMNGMALHGGVMPYSGGFLIFSDYCRPSIRLSALMNQRVLHVMTHDSIGLGEDGPTHQPVEHLAALRAIPNLTVFRPADAVEMAETWDAAIKADGPSVLALTRQGLPVLREGAGDQVSKGAYELRAADGEAKVTLFASGSEVEIAVVARDALQAEGIGTRVVSVPSFELFDSQDDSYKLDVIGNSPAKVAVEAAIEMGWSKFIGATGKFVGMSSFGASAPAGELYEHFGITSDAVVAAAKAQL